MLPDTASGQFCVAFNDTGILESCLIGFVRSDILFGRCLKRLPGITVVLSVLTERPRKQSHFVVQSVVGRIINHAAMKLLGIIDVVLNPIRHLIMRSEISRNCRFVLVPCIGRSMPRRFDSGSKLIGLFTPGDNAIDATTNMIRDGLRGWSSGHFCFYELKIWLSSFSAKHCLFLLANLFDQSSESFTANSFRSVFSLP